MENTNEMSENTEKNPTEKDFQEEGGSNCGACQLRDQQNDTSDSQSLNSKDEQNGLLQSRKRRVMFVIAHPDDECMFFGPSILHFTQKENALVYLLCLTDGKCALQSILIYVKTSV